MPLVEPFTTGQPGYTRDAASLLDSIYPTLRWFRRLDSGLLNQSNRDWRENP
jgi:hypothetical protein